MLDNAHKPAKDIHILVDNDMVNVGVQIVATIDMVELVGVTAMGEMLEIGKIVYIYIFKKKETRDVTSKRSNKLTSAEKSLIITIFGYGLGLGTENSSTLVSTNLEEYQDVMKFALKLWI